MLCPDSSRNAAAAGRPAPRPTRWLLAAALAGGSFLFTPSSHWSRTYGTETDPAPGRGVVHWSHTRQAAFFLPRSERGTNVAGASQGATASASSTFNSGTPASSAIDGRRLGLGWGHGGGWSSLFNPTSASPQWIQIDFREGRPIQEIVVTTLQDNYATPIEPSAATTFNTYGIRDYALHYWTGSAWAPLASVVANDKVVRRFAFPPVTTARIRLTITAALQNYARVVEVEAYEAAGAL